MEQESLSNLLNEANNFTFVTRKHNISQINTNYGIENEIIYKTEVLKSNICDYNIMLTF